MRNSMQELNKLLKDMDPDEREELLKCAAEHIIKEVKGE